MSNAKYYCTFDLETTGLNREKDQIIQFAAVKHDKQTLELVDQIDLYIRPTGTYQITLAAYFKHHITPAFLEDKPTLAEVAPKIVEFMKGCDILGYNHKSFDIPFLVSALEKAGYSLDILENDVYDVFLEEKIRNGNSLGDTFKRYYGKTMDEAGYEAHNALSDVMATFDIFKAHQSTGEVKPTLMFGTDNAITMMDFMGKLQPCFSIGKYRQIPVSYVVQKDPDYIKWCLSDSCNFFKSTKEFLKEQLQ